MSFCINCGEKLDKSNSFCVKCGSKIKNTPLHKNKVFEEENTRGFKKSEFRFKAEKKSKKPFKFIISLFILIIFFGGFAYLINESKSNGREGLRPSRPTRTLRPTRPKRTLRPTRPTRTLRPTRPSKTKDGLIQEIQDFFKPNEPNKPNKPNKSNKSNIITSEYLDEFIEEEDKEGDLEDFVLWAYDMHGMSFEESAGGGSCQQYTAWGKNDEYMVSENIMHDQRVYDLKILIES